MPKASSVVGAEHSARTSPAEENDLGVLRRRLELSYRLKLSLGLVLGLGFGSVACAYLCGLCRLRYLRSLPPELRAKRALSISVAPTPREVSV